MLQALIPTISKLADKHFLEGVKRCVTQNPNEALNHVIWSLAPKEQFVLSQETSLAVSLGVCLFNSGFSYTFEKIMELCNLSYTKYSQNIWKNIDQERIKHDNYRMTVKSKQKRKQK